MTGEQVSVGAGRSLGAIGRENLGVRKRADAMNPSEQDPKFAKKMAKAAAKAAKKSRGTVAAPPAAAAPVGGRSPAERSADAAERQVKLQRWRIIMAAVAVLVALVTLLVTLTR